MRDHLGSAEVEVITPYPSSQEELRNYTHRVVVFGSRNFSDYDLFSEQMFQYLEDRQIKKGDVIFLSGKARTGADDMIIFWCKENGYPWTEHEADWDDVSSKEAIVVYNRKTGRPYNRLAGHWRNDVMAELCTAGISFYDGASPGTKDMISRLEKRNLPLRKVLIKCS